MTQTARLCAWIQSGFEYNIADFVIVWLIYFTLKYDNINNFQFTKQMLLNEPEPRHEKTGSLPMRKQRRRSAVQ